MIETLWGIYCLTFVIIVIGAVFVYVATHIDEIKEKQAAAVKVTMDEQDKNVRNAQETQRLAIEKAQRQQQEAIRKIAEDAKKRSN